MTEISKEDLYFENKTHRYSLAKKLRFITSVTDGKKEWILLFIAELITS